MPSDFDYYIDLTPLDVSPAQIYLDSIEVARTVLPEFDLRIGTIEDAMFQAFAYMSALNIGAINRLPDSLFLGAIKMIGTQFKDGDRPTMSVTFTANSNSGASIPAGTIVQYSLSDDDYELSFVFETNTLLTIAANAVDDPLPTGSVTCTCQVVGTIPEIANGTELQIVSYNPSLYSAVANGSFVQGSEAESLSGFRDRGVASLAAMSSALVTASQAKNFIIATNPNLVSRAKVYDLTDKDGSLNVGDAAVAGHVTIYAYGPKRFLTEGEKTTILATVTEKSVAGLDVGIKDPVLLDLKITASISHFSTVTSVDLKTALENQILSNLSVDNSSWDEELVRYNDILSIFLSSPLVRNVDSLVIAITDTGTITNAVKSGNNVTYTCANKFAVGDLVTVTGITPNTLNSTQRAITARTATNFTVSNSSASGAYTSGGTCSVSYPYWGAASGNDFLFSKKGSLINISSQKIVLTLTAV